MASKIVIHGSEIHAVYDDRFMPILHAIGDVHIERASDVEYLPKHKLWVAIRRKTGKLLAIGSNRNEVIKQEIKRLEEELTCPTLLK